MLLSVILLIIAAVGLAAHFLRNGELLLVTVCLLLPLLLFLKKRWSLIVLQLFAYLGTLVWVQTAVQIVQERVALGRPWARMVVILGTVALLTALAGLLLNSAVVKEKYPP